MIPVILTFRYQLPHIEPLTTTPTPGEPLGVLRSPVAATRVRVLMCDASPIAEAFPELLEMQDEGARTQKLMESLGLLFHMAREAHAGRKLPNPLALSPKGTVLVNGVGETQAIWADIPPPPREMETKAVDLFLSNVVALGLNNLSIPLKPFDVAHEEWATFFKEGADHPTLKKEVPDANGMLEELNRACVSLAFSDGFQMPSRSGGQILPAPTSIKPAGLS